ncbi:MAG: DUF2786 domain-containing protein [Deltaproteobacteria bacterium]|nr:DUF2786 domain-containing protein [Deltaproteobacteria bacterium]
MSVWTAQLDNLLLDALQRAWRSCNADFFDDQLKPPVLALDDTVVRLGQWHRVQRLLSLSRPLVRTRSWQAVREILKHEMAHQFVDEVLGKHEETAHGPAFLAVCAARGIDARARGSVDDDVVSAGGNDDDDRVMRRVQKLLALAESDNPNEAEAAANAAQRLMLEHNIAARGRTGRVYVTRALGPPAFRLYAHERILAGLLAKHFFVDVVFSYAYVPDAGRNGNYVEVSGTPDNLAMAEWINGFLLAAGERVCRHQIQAGVVVGRDRLRFLAGFMSGVGDKLAREARKNSAEGLVWIGDPDLKAHVRRLHPRLYATSVRSVVNEAHQRGRAAGNDVVISRPVSGPATARGRLLGR